MREAFFRKFFSIYYLQGILSHIRPDPASSTTALTPPPPHPYIWGFHREPLRKGANNETQTVKGGGVGLRPAPQGRGWKGSVWVQHPCVKLLVSSGGGRGWEGVGGDTLCPIDDTTQLNGSSRSEQWPPHNTSIIWEQSDPPSQHSEQTPVPPQHQHHMRTEWVPPHNTNIIWEQSVPQSVLRVFNRVSLTTPVADENSHPLATQALDENTCSDTPSQDKPQKRTQCPPPHNTVPPPQHQHQMRTQHNTSRRGPSRWMTWRHQSSDNRC